MNDIVIERVTTSRQRKQFLEFPWTIYQNDPYWIPPLRVNQKEIVGYSHNPFYDRNQIQTFLAYRGGEVVGRIGAILNQGHINRYDDRRGFFGFFESIDDQEVANGLFDAARDWFADQGIFKLRGPTNPSLNYEVGLLDRRLRFVADVHDDLQPALLRTADRELRLPQDPGPVCLLGAHLDAAQGGREAAPDRASRSSSATTSRSGRWTSRDSAKTSRSFLSIYNRSLTNTWGFVPMSDGEVEHMAKGLQHLIVPELAIARGDRRAAGRGHVRPAGLQPADQGNRRPALPLRLHPSPAQQAARSRRSA